MRKISSCQITASILALPMANHPIHPGDAVTTQQVEHIYAGLLDHTLPKEEWTHEGHLCAGTAMVVKRGIKTAQQDMPDIIRSYNLACGGQNSDTDGYHHTITLFYLHSIEKFLRENNAPARNLGRQASAVLQSQIAGPDYPLKFYTRDFLFSPKARQKWQAPNLQDLP